MPQMRSALLTSNTDAYIRNALQSVKHLKTVSFKYRMFPVNQSALIYIGLQCFQVYITVYMHFC